MSGFRYGCGAQMTAFVPKGYEYREISVRCGSTAHDGGVNQCDDCARKTPVVPTLEDESDEAWAARQADFEERRYYSRDEA